MIFGFKGFLVSRASGTLGQRGIEKAGLTLVPFFGAYIISASWALVRGRCILVRY